MKLPINRQDSDPNVFSQGLNQLAAFQQNCQEGCQGLDKETIENTVIP
jgi:hypothetical protein